MRVAVAMLTVFLSGSPAVAADGEPTGTSPGARAVLDAFRAAAQPTAPSAARLSAAEAAAIRERWLGSIGTGGPPVPGTGDGAAGSAR